MLQPVMAQNDGSQGRPLVDPSCVNQPESRATLQCLAQYALRVDEALDRNYRLLTNYLFSPNKEMLQAEQQTWEQERDSQCTPKDRPASDANALAAATFCRTQMARERIEYLQKHWFDLLRAQLAK